MIYVQQRREYYRQKVLIESFHLSSSGFNSFRGLVKFAFGSEKIKYDSGIIQKES